MDKIFIKLGCSLMIRLSLGNNSILKKENCNGAFIKTIIAYSVKFYQVILSQVLPKINKAFVILYFFLKGKLKQ